MQRVILFGATSSIGSETARVLAPRGTSFFLVARDGEKLRVVAEDLKARGAKQVAVAQADLADQSRHEGLFKEAESALGEIDGILVAHGSLGDQKACENDFSIALREININFLSALSLVHIAARIFEARRAGTICVIASVAGDRGRKKNYIYCTAKGALALALQGVRGRLVASGVKVITIKPGFVDTPMTKDLKKGPLFASPETVARGIVRAINKGHEVVYLPWFWRGIMFIVKSIPEPIFKRLNL